MSEGKIPDDQATVKASEGVVDLPTENAEVGSNPAATKTVLHGVEAAAMLPPEIATENTISSGTYYGPVVQGRDIHVTLDGPALADSERRRAREVFLSALKHREEFVGSFLKQALQQANTTFRFSMAFMTAGGLIFLVAAVLALTYNHGGSTRPVALVASLGGLLIGGSGAAFSVKSDKARKHLAAQAERMHSQLLDERRFTEVAELLSGIKNPDVNDRARVALALKLMGAPPEPNWNEIPPSPNDEADV
jgi:hypothetical protein